MSSSPGSHMSPSASHWLLNDDAYVKFDAVLQGLDGRQFKDAMICICGRHFASHRFLDRLIYWFSRDKHGTPRVRVKHKGKFWVAKAVKEWTSEEGLSRFQVEESARRLKERKLIETLLYPWKGAPTLHYTICFENLATVFEKFSGSNEPPARRNTVEGCPQNAALPSHQQSRADLQKTGKASLSNGARNLKNDLRETSKSSTARSSAQTKNQQQQGKKAADADAPSGASGSRPPDIVTSSPGVNPRTPGPAVGPVTKFQPPVVISEDPASSQDVLTYLAWLWKVDDDMNDQDFNAALRSLPQSTRKIVFFMFLWKVNYEEHFDAPLRFYTDNVDAVEELVGYFELGDVKGLVETAIRGWKLKRRPDDPGFDKLFFARNHSYKIKGFCRHYDKIVAEFKRANLC